MRHKDDAGTDEVRSLYRFPYSTKTTGGQRYADLCVKRRKE